MKGELEKPLANELDEKMVADYLRHHADFFERHQALLVELRLPHEAGGAVSLIERQVKILREQRQQLKNKLGVLIHNAKYNEELSQRLHELTLALLKATDLKELFEILKDRLLDRFNADAVTIRLFRTPPPGYSGVEFTGQDELHARRFERVFNAEEPLRGRLSPELLEELFKTGAADIASAALIPLGNSSEPLGVLSLGSHDPERFHQQAGAMFLRSLGEIFTSVMKIHLAHGPVSREPTPEKT